jgi:hypothetical protein
MSSIGAELLDCLKSVERAGDFCVGGVRDIFMPAIDVEGVGRIAIPLLPAQAERLVAIADPAPYGRGAETIIDRDVRRSWQIEPGKVRIGGRRWPETLAELVAAAAAGLGVIEPVAAEFYKLLLYDAGSFFIDHRDTEKAPGMFATMLLVLPSAHRGGELVIRHVGREVVLDLRPEDPAEIGFAAFYADCVHEVRPVIAGHRVTLVYNLRFLGKRRALKAPDYRAVERRVAELLGSWAGAEDEPDKLILPLEHAYTPAALSFGALKGADAGIASVLVKAAAEADCDLHLALVSIEESGTAEYSGSYRRRGWSRDAEEFTVGEVCDRAMLLSEWRHPDGRAVGFRDFPFAEDELCPPDAFDALTPDEEHFHEATGNEGASFERSYRRAGLVIWPHVRRLAVLNQAGLAVTLPHLEDLAARWQASDGATRSAIWREADELSGHMLRSWPRPSWGGDGHAMVGRMLDSLARLGNAARIEAALAELPAEGHYAGSDNAAIVRAAALVPRPRATELLVRIVRRNASADLAACGQLVRLCAASPGDPVVELPSLGAALLDMLPGDPAKPAERETWHPPTPVKPGFVADLLTACSRIDAGLASLAIEHMLAWPGTYQPDDVLVPAALEFARQTGNPPWPAVRRLREAALAHLRGRIALTLEPPPDWTRDNPLTCACAECRDLGLFLVDPHQRQWRLRAVQQRRIHVEQSVRQVSCDLDLATEKRGSPHTLVATKNQASYERRARQRRKDLADVSDLGG